MRFSTGDAPSRSLQLGVKNPKVAGFKRTVSFMSTAGLTDLPDIRGSTQMVERPVIMVIDDEPDALAAMLDALTRRFGGDYRVVPHLSGHAALAGVAKIQEEKLEIALIIADQRMPEMTGREFLARVRSIVPTAKRALMVDWGDHEVSSTVLQACALGELDNYLYKPWTPAEVHLYPLISEFLAEWTRVHRPGMELIYVVGDEQAPRSNEIRELLNRNGIPFGFYEVGSEPANRLIKERGAEIAAFPAISPRRRNSGGSDRRPDHGCSR
jgi:thioredoxin reductase (NADPH)